jgi:hypothetical protein
MAVLRTDFGFLPESLNCDTGRMSVRDLPDREAVTQEILESPYISKNWIYAPRCRTEDFMTGAVTEEPFSARVFGLQKTHEIEHGNAGGPEHLHFLIWCLGFFQGIRLTDTEAGFLDATPIKTGELTDFRLVKRGVPDALDLAEDFWQQHACEPRTTKRVAGIIHTLFLAQNPTYLPFEQFSYLYMALDACYALAKVVYRDPGNIPHYRRPEWLCEQFDIPVPSWAAASEKASEVAGVRNDTIHEALFFEEPLGFSLYGSSSEEGRSGNVPLEMTNLVCRLLVALLGKPDAEYVQTPVTTRQIHGLDLS